MKVPQSSGYITTLCSPSTLAARRMQVQLWWRCASRALRTGELELELPLALSSLTARPCEFQNFSVHKNQRKISKESRPLDKRCIKTKRRREATGREWLCNPAWWLCSQSLNNSQRKKDSSPELKWTHGWSLGECKSWDSLLLHLILFTTINPLELFTRNQ